MGDNPLYPDNIRDAQGVLRANIRATKGYLVATRSPSDQRVGNFTVELEVNGDEIKGKYFDHPAKCTTLTLHRVRRLRKSDFDDK
jgi:hypothetical protein